MASLIFIPKEYHENSIFFRIVVALFASKAKINIFQDNVTQKNENFKEIDACLNALLNEPHVERLKTMEVTQKVG